MIPHAKPLLGQEEFDGVKEVMASGMLAAGKYVLEFEKSFQAYINTPYALATSSGTTALQVIMSALEIGPGDKVLTTPFSFIASSNALLFTGAVPIFVDIDPITFNLSPTGLEKAIKNHPEAKAVLVVHLFGLPADMEEICQLAQKNNLLLIEDCAQAHGALYKERYAGTFGHAAAFSFYPTKNITSGEGGMVVTGDSALAEKVRLLVNQGQQRRYYHEVVGYNYRMTDIHAAIGLAQLKKLTSFNQKRNQNAQFYNTHINNPLVKKPQAPPDRSHAYHQYTLTTDCRDALAAWLTDNQIGYGIHYPMTIPSQPCYRNLDCSKGTWPVAEKLAASCISIPVHPGLNIADLKTVADTINSFTD
ncbi:Glutamine--scyllo-inositol transaminase [Desulfofarcimen acetoxidans DSM 771]|uniref:Glutamine--scyllo-inositol transaminase n=1 Tax=Desulfofarcimen acetoxidans (strain ATCC 49208 / DSM 771 / KCTC 5769 / VKM B-1644 / 5575) TaxID=485916 RepID=C8W4F3_DESAS|nr:DegT/DnrJ/EryC1/StrS family aminotransferase [Desulfofarcimen acetoxidans]ACV62021.1 Glutamine--scyllo-inositol transaminase [Desulfofarcimen acetoxidans DSM 771]